MDATNLVAVIDRPNDVYGCTFNGTGPHNLGRRTTFTLQPVKTTKKSGQPLLVSKSEVRKLAGLLG